MENINNTSNVLQIYAGALDKLALQNETMQWGNNMPFMNKSLAWAHMKKNYLQNRFF